MAVDRSKFTGTKIIKLYSYTIEMDYECLKKYIIRFTNILSIEQDKLQQEYDTAINENPDSQEWLDYSIEDEADQLYRIIPKYMNNSMFLTSYSIFENKMREICGIIVSQYLIKVKIKKDSGLSDYWGFLQGTLRINLGEFKNDWKKINNHYRPVRDALVHRNGEISKEEKQLIEKDIRLFLHPNGFNFFVKDISYVNDFIEITHNILKGIIKATDDINWQKETVAEIKKIKQIDNN